MAHVCVIGGTRFVGKLLVQTLIDEGHDVTIITRGQSADDLGDSVRRLHADATDAEQLTSAVAGRSFDAVIHQVCYTPNAALAAVAAFGDRVGKYVMTSTIEVYNPSSFGQAAPQIGGFALEEELDTRTYGYDTELPWHEQAYIAQNYGEGKRQAEAALWENAPVPVVIPRAAHVFAEVGDFTGRFQFHVDRVLARQPILTHVDAGLTSVVLALDVARFLAWAATSTVEGTYNVCSVKPVSVADMCAVIEDVSGVKAIIEERDQLSDAERRSPFSYPSDFTMSPHKAMEAGFAFMPTHRWLSRLASVAVANGRARHILERAG
ncbi:NAD-dependent epimerase/dehydratase family protein [Natronoglycomyces albus]|uniref:UDP-glucose 4-epimerase n=1 Tax=Natronoglycomyces albus TaxID=2811108 RepID=A0A895XRD7_9ACTN|nr:NAD-dependent epimerase/dehydratase family protein [Natronoglycomyces albus]QSB04168.1 NAD(P)H-binding protein [Natronoglycomyces albus]